jgi:putative endonuclease
MFFVYVIRSLKDGKLYVGLTNNVEKRISEHNDGKCIATKLRRPFTLLYYESFSNRTEAAKREKFFKSGKGREFLKGVLN